MKTLIYSYAGRRSSKKKKGKAFLYFLGIIFLMSVAGALIYVLYMLYPAAENDGEKQTVVIEQGTSTEAAAEYLEKQQLIRNAVVFQYYSYLRPDSLKAGTYRLSASMSAGEIAHTLEAGQQAQEPVVSITIPEGRSLEQIARISAKNADFSEEIFMETATDEAFIRSLSESYSFIREPDKENSVRYALEGYLSPQTYEYYGDSPGAEAVVKDMIERTNETMVEFSNQITSSPWNAREIWTIASIVEREAARAEDRAPIAGVIENRLEKNMRLEMDPTVAHALGEHRLRTSFNDLRVASPYNTYRNRGLPPGPIASPGIQSVEAALNPENTEALYFYARPNGEVIYNETYEQHTHTQRKYESEWENQ
ncbi:endolytic transglycosylase MltG [Marinococcus halotolerans]|uniref:endolytic transglycosylase MltG n=1 Tax=Marinococcus halotolerans TaxID=301092 RepID=UPI0003B7B4B3|nr:endolytic transglycosylase MltG [Marinococcus halotolerans]